MEIKVARKAFSKNSTIGMLFVNGEFECYTLEDVVRPTKIYGETAIPAGKYKVVVTYSPAFKQQLPLLVDVPGYSGVRIHVGNDKTNTLGCLLVGQQKGVDFIGKSRPAFNALMAKIQAAAASEEVIIELADEPDQAPAARRRSRAAPKAAAAAGLPVVRLGMPWMPEGSHIVAAAPKKAAPEKAAPKKAASKKAAPKKAAPKKTASKKTVAKKAVTKKRGAKNVATKGAAAKPAAKSTAKRAPAGKAGVKSSG